MNIVFLMGGEDINDKVDTYPVYMAETSKEIVIEKQISNYKKMGPEKMVFCVRKNDIKKFNVVNVIRQSIEKFTCVEICGSTAGSICTALLAAEHIDNDSELVLVAIDELIEADPVQILDEFRTKNCDAGVVSFHSVHPRYSFARLDGAGNVCEVAEKNPISKNALASFYYFREGRDFIECAKNVVRKDSRTNNAFYISQAVNEMILHQKMVGIHHIPNNDFYPLKTASQIAQYMMEYQRRKYGMES